MSKLLSDKDIKSELAELNDWSYDGVKISKEIARRNGKYPAIIFDMNYDEDDATIEDIGI